MTYRTTLLGLAFAALAIQPFAAEAQTAPAPPLAPAAATPSPPEAYTPPAASPESPAPPGVATPSTVEAPAAGTPVAPSPDSAQETAPPSPTGGDAILAAAQALPTAVEDVQVVGPWMDGERNGIWRTLMMQVGTAEKDSYRFFIQQIEKAAAAQTVLSTTEITEIAGIDGAIVGYRADEPSEEDPSGLTLFFDIVPSDGEIAETYELHFFKDQPYTFGPASN